MHLTEQEEAETGEHYSRGHTARKSCWESHPAYPTPQKVSHPLPYIPHHLTGPLVKYISDTYSFLSRPEAQRLPAAQDPKDHFKARKQDREEHFLHLKARGTQNKDK